MPQITTKGIFQWHLFVKYYLRVNKWNYRYSILTFMSVFNIMQTCAHKPVMHPKIELLFFCRQWKLISCTCELLHFWLTLLKNYIPIGNSQLLSLQKIENCTKRMKNMVLVQSTIFVLVCIVFILLCFVMLVMTVHCLTVSEARTLNFLKNWKLVIFLTWWWRRKKSSMAWSMFQILLSHFYFSVFPFHNIILLFASSLVYAISFFLCSPFTFFSSYFQTIYNGYWFFTFYFILFSFPIHRLLSSPSSHFPFTSSHNW